MRHPSVEMPGYHVAAAPQGGNYFSIVNVTPNLQTNPATTCILAGVLYVRESGIFRVTARLPFSGGTTAKTIAHTFTTKQFPGPNSAHPVTQPTVGLAGTGELAAGFLGSDVGIPFLNANQVVPAQAAVLNADAAGGIGLNFNGAAIDPSGGGFVTQSTETTATLTGLLTAQASGVNAFDIDAVIHAAGNAAKSPFEMGGIVVFGIVVTSAADVVTYGGCSFNVQEMPRS